MLQGLIYYETLWVIFFLVVLLVDQLRIDFAHKWSQWRAILFIRLTAYSIWALETSRFIIRPSANLAYLAYQTKFSKIFMRWLILLLQRGKVIIGWILVTFETFPLVCFLLLIFLFYKKIYYFWQLIYLNSLFGVMR